MHTDVGANVVMGVDVAVLVADVVPVLVADVVSVVVAVEVRVVVAVVVTVDVTVLSSHSEKVPAANASSSRFRWNVVSKQSIESLRKLAPVLSVSHVRLPTTVPPLLRESNRVKFVSAELSVAAKKAHPPFC